MDHDEALIRRAQQGDAGAFEQLLESNYETVYRFAYKWCGKQEDAEDITQQACIKLARVLGQFRFESAFSSWLYRLVINCARDWSRSQRRHTDASEPLQENTLQPANGNPVEAQVHRWQLLGQLDQLPDGIKETLLLVHAEGMTHSEAATVLAVKESTVSWRLHEFRKNFSLLIEREGL
ncbi:MAG: RNA polymerase sigma factor [Halieaceae bacterium]